MEKHYIKKKPLVRLLYKKCTNWVCEMLKDYYDDTFVKLIRIHLECNYDDVIENLPYIGGRKNIFTAIIVLNGWFVCLYRAMVDFRQPVEVAVYFNRKVSEKLFKKVPRPIGVFIGGLAFRNVGKKFFEKQATRSQEKKYSNDFVYQFDIEKTTFEFSECAVHKYYEQEDAQALKQYCNFADPLYAGYYKMGCDASHTMAHGHASCVLSFDRKAETRTPDNIQEMIEKAEAYLFIHK